jgi:hypothetical protein
MFPVFSSPVFWPRFGWSTQWAVCTSSYAVELGYGSYGVEPWCCPPKNGAKFHSNWLIITLASKSLLVSPRYKWVGKLHKR